MWKAEVDFPRGGRRKAAPVADSLPQPDPDFDFDELKDDVTDVSKGGKVKGEKSKKRKLPTHDSQSEQSGAKRPKKAKKPALICGPLHNDLSADVCVLACVRLASNYTISVSLPGNMAATLPITEISPAYTKQLHALAQADDPSALEEVAPVEQLFRPGLLLPVKVTEVTDGRQPGKRLIKVSSSPAVVNAGLPVKAVTNGQLLCGNVSSVEDHGYRVDLGIKTLQAFLAAKDANKLITKQGFPLGVGQPLWCVLNMADTDGVRAGESRAVKVTVDPEVVRASQLSETTNLDSLRPGMTVPAVVQSVSTNGLSVSVFTFQGVIHSTQLVKSSDQYKPGEQIGAKILYVNQTTKELQLTNLVKHVQFDGQPIDFFGELKAGDFADGKATRVLKGKGIYFALPGKAKGFAALSHLSDKEKDIQDLANFQKGQTHRCRVVGFNYMEGVALVTLKQSILDQKFLSIADISVGDVHPVTIKEVTLNGLVVKLSKGIYSFISCMHLADVPIKHPEKKFQAGKTVKARVLRVDLQNSKVQLTLKRSLVRLPGPVLSEYSQIRPYMELEGYIVAIKDTAVVVGFFNGVQGYVTLKDMSTEKVDDPSALFYKGQVIRCRVVHFNADDRKLKLSFNFGEKRQKEKEKNEKTPEAEFEVGKIVTAKVVCEEKGGFRVQLVASEQVALLPFPHLSDFHEVQETRRQALRPGQTIDRVAYFTNRTRIIVTMKESILRAAEAKTIVRTFEDMSAGMLLPAVIKNHQEYGMFLELAGGFTGLCPAKVMTSVQPASLESVFPVGQSVVARVTRLDTEKIRFLGSVRLSETFEGGVADSLSLVEVFLQARDDAGQLLYAEKEELAAYSDLCVGNKVEVKVTSVLKKGVLGELPSGANALATKHHYGDIEPEVGSTYEAVVLFVDPLTPCVELTIEPRIVKAVTTLRDNAKTQVKAGQILKADVVLVKPEFMLMCARGHASGRLLYVPVRQHINDVDTNKPYKPGTFTEVVIKHTTGSYQLAVLRSQDPEANKKKGLDMKNLKQHNLKPGTVVDAKIRAVHPLQLNIEVGKVHGRVHITEVDDAPSEGDNPLSSYKQGHGIKVVVIGLRDVKSETYLPISHPKAKRTLLECSVRSSKLSNPADEGNLVPRLDLTRGQEVTGFVISSSPQKVWLQLSLSQQGYVDQFHLTTDLQHVRAVKFRPGQSVQATVLDNVGKDKLALSFVGKQHTVSDGAELPAVITSLRAESSIHVKLPDGRAGLVKSKPSVLHFIGQLIWVKVDQSQGVDVCLLSLLDKTPTLLKKQRKRKTSLTDEEARVVEREKIAKKKQQKTEKKKKKKDEAEDQGDSGVDVAREALDSDKEAEDTRTQKSDGERDDETPRLAISGFSWGGELTLDTDAATNKDDDDDDDDTPADSKTRRKRKRDEEKLIQEYERSQLDGNAAPATAQDFERLVVASPDSSMVWLRYMAHHAGLGEMERAKAVAEKALNTISFREEQEKKNVWLAYLNLEVTYGDAADVKKLLERAITYNDPLDIYLKMCDIYAQAGKNEDAEHLYSVMSRKFKRDKSVWKAYGQFLFKSGRLQSARNLLQRCTDTLDKKEHVEVITRFASLEFSVGDVERGRTMFENLIASYPGRTDIWSVYTDLVAKSGDIQGARDILERAVKQKFAAKKLSFLLQKMIRFEETHGTDAQVDKVKEMALTLLES